MNKYNITLITANTKTTIKFFRLSNILFFEFFFLFSLLFKKWIDGVVEKGIRVGTNGENEFEVNTACLDWHAYRRTHRVIVWSKQSEHNHMDDHQYCIMDTCIWLCNAEGL